MFALCAFLLLFCHALEADRFSLLTVTNFKKNLKWREVIIDDNHLCQYWKLPCCEAKVYQFCFFFTLTLDGCCKVLCTSLLSAVSMHVIDADDLYAVGSSRDSTLIVSELEQKSNSTVTAWQILNISVTTDSFWSICSHVCSCMLCCYFTV